MGYGPTPPRLWGVCVCVCGAALDVLVILWNLLWVLMLAKRIWSRLKRRAHFSKFFFTVLYCTYFVCVYVSIDVTCRLLLISWRSIYLWLTWRKEGTFALPFTSSMTPRLSACLPTCLSAYLPADTHNHHLTDHVVCTYESHTCLHSPLLIHRLSHWLTHLLTHLLTDSLM